MDPSHLSPAEYRAIIESPFADELIAESATGPLLLVRGSSESIASPGSLPVVVAWIGSEFGGDGPPEADLVIGLHDVDALTAQIEQAPLAAATLAVLLRGQGHLVGPSLGREFERHVSQGQERHRRWSLPTDPHAVDRALAAESAAYSLLQAGPEFAAWRSRNAPKPDPSETATVLMDRDGDLLTITLHRPHRHNAVSTRLRDELAAALAIAVADSSLTVHLRGAGPSFCSGGDLHEFGSRPDVATSHMTRLTRSPGRTVHQLRDRMTAYIHGQTLGGGLEMAAFAGRVIAEPKTVMALPEIGLGLIPGAGGTVSVTQRIGRQRTAALALTGRTIDAFTALRWGLIDEIATSPTI